MFICEKCMIEMTVERTISIENFQGTNETMDGYIMYCSKCGIRVINGWSMVGKITINGITELMERRKDERNNFS